MTSRRGGVALDDSARCPSCHKPVRGSDGGDEEVPRVKEGKRCPQCRKKVEHGTRDRTKCNGLCGGGGAGGHRDPTAYLAFRKDERLRGGASGGDGSHDTGFCDGRCGQTEGERRGRPKYPNSSECILCEDNPKVKARRMGGEALLETCKRGHKYRVHTHCRGQQCKTITKTMSKKKKETFKCYSQNWCFQCEGQTYEHPAYNLEASSAAPPRKVSVTAAKKKKLAAAAAQATSTTKVATSAPAVIELEVSMEGKCGVLLKDGRTMCPKETTDEKSGMCAAHAEKHNKMIAVQEKFRVDAAKKKADKERIAAERREAAAAAAEDAAEDAKERKKRKQKKKKKKVTPAGAPTMHAAPVPRAAPAPAPTALLPRAAHGAVVSASAALAAAAAAAVAPMGEHFSECPICCEALELLSIKPCGHDVCPSCLNMWRGQSVYKQKRATCPLCRGAIDNADDFSAAGTKSGGGGAWGTGSIQAWSAPVAVPDVASAIAPIAAIDVPSWVGGTAPSAPSTATAQSWVDGTASSFEDIDLSGVLADLMAEPVNEGLVAAPRGLASGGSVGAVPPGLAFASSANSSNANFTPHLGELAATPPPGLASPGYPGWAAPVADAPRALHSLHAAHDDDDASSVSSYASTRSFVSQTSQISRTTASPLPTALSHTGPDGKEWRAFHIHRDRIGGLMGKGGSVMTTLRQQSGVSHLGLELREEQSNPVWRRLRMRAIPSKCAKAESIIRSIVGQTNVYQIPTDREHIWWLGKEPNARARKLVSAERGAQSRPTQQRQRSNGGGWRAAAPITRDGWTTAGQGRRVEGSALGSGKRSTKRASDDDGAAASPKERTQLSAQCTHATSSTMPYHLTVRVPEQRAVYALRSLHPDAAAHGKKAAPLLINILGQTGKGKSSVSVQLVGDTKLLQCIKPAAKTKMTGGGRRLAGGVDVIHVFAASKKSASKALALIYGHFKYQPVPELATLAMRAPHPPREKDAAAAARQHDYAREADQQSISVQKDFDIAHATARREKEAAQFNGRAKAEAERRLRRDEQIAINMQFNAKQQAKHRTGRSEQPDFAQRRVPPLGAAGRPTSGARSGTHPGARTGGRSSAANSGKVEWNCSACTFLNTSERSGARAICTMCCTSSAWSSLQLTPSSAGGSAYQRQPSGSGWDLEDDEIDLIPGGSDW